MRTWFCNKPRSISISRKPEKGEPVDWSQTGLNCHSQIQLTVRITFLGFCNNKKDISIYKVILFAERKKWFRWYSGNKKNKEIKNKEYFQ